jgi:hypothetical protein
LYCIYSLNRPDIQHFLEKLKREKEAKLNAQENDNRPFILKYVSSQNNIYLIFFLLLILVEIFVTNCRHLRPSRCFYRCWWWWAIVLFFFSNPHRCFLCFVTQLFSIISIFLSFKKKRTSIPIFVN